jgi:hypothetical protein
VRATISSPISSLALISLDGPATEGLTTRDMDMDFLMNWRTQDENARMVPHRSVDFGLAAPHAIWVT